MDKYVNKDIICAKMMYCNFRSPNMTVSDFINNELPTADVQPVKRGKWLHDRKTQWKCSECGNFLDFDGLNCGRGSAFYCPNFGADMRGPEPIKG